MQGRSSTMTRPQSIVSMRSLIWYSRGDIRLRRPEDLSLQDRFMVEQWKNMMLDSVGLPVGWLEADGGGESVECVLDVRPRRGACSLRRGRQGVLSPKPRHNSSTVRVVATSPSRADPWTCSHAPTPATLPTPPLRVFRPRLRIRSKAVNGGGVRPHGRP